MKMSYLRNSDSLPVALNPSLRIVRSCFGPATWQSVKELDFALLNQKRQDIFVECLIIRLRILILQQEK